MEVSGFMRRQIRLPYVERRFLSIPQLPFASAISRKNGFCRLVATRVAADAKQFQWVQRKLAAHLFMRET